MGGGEKDAATKDRLQGRAVELLQQARAGGLFAASEAKKKIQEAEVLQPIKDRADFKKFLADLDADRRKKRGALASVGLRYCPIDVHEARPSRMAVPRTFP